MVRPIIFLPSLAAIGCFANKAIFTNFQPMAVRAHLGLAIEAFLAAPKSLIYAALRT